jgi:hemolysin activation/secretion protein
MQSVFNQAFVVKRPSNVVVTGTELALACGLLLAACAAQAQVDAGALRQQIERDQVFRLPKLQAPVVQTPRVQRAPSGPKVLIERFVLRGHSLVPEDQLQAALSPFLGRPLSFSQLEDAAATVGDQFRALGWTVRVFLPEQDIVQGVATIEVVEATLGAVRSDGDVAKPSSLAALRKVIEASQPAGDFLNSHRIDRGLLIANDISGVTVAGSLVEGQEQAQTDLLLKTLAKPPFEVNLSQDNTGSYATGSSRVAALINFNRFLLPGGVLSTQMAYTEGSKYGRLGVNVPVGSHGLRATASASHLDYQVVNLPVEVQGRGSSQTYGLELTYPLVRERNRNVYVNLAWDEKVFINYDPLGLLSSDYFSRSWSLSLQGNRETEWLGLSGAFTASLAASSGVLDLRGSPNEDTLAKDANPAGHFTKLRWTISQEQPVFGNVSLYGAFSGQWASKNLDSSEKFTLGGASGVRAYGSGEAAGTHGRMLNLELRWRWSSTLSLASFYDIGWVRTNLRNGYPGAPEVNRYGLRGSGLAINWQALDALSVRAVWARRSGQNPKPDDVTGRDQDGTLIKNRVWLTLSASF